MQHLEDPPQSPLKSARMQGCSFASPKLRARQGDFESSRFSPLKKGYGVHISLDQPQNATFRPPSPPKLGGTGVLSPPELGDLGGE